MKRFHVFHLADEGLQSVKIGVSWPAFCGSIFWMLYHRLWLLSGIWICSATLLWSMDDSGEWSRLIFAAGVVALAIVPHIRGNEWREARLLERGYELLTIVEATTPQTAALQIDQILAGLEPASSRYPAIAIDPRLSRWKISANAIAPSDHSPRPFAPQP